jgi:hypothetical protein
MLLGNNRSLVRKPRPAGRREIMGHVDVIESQGFPFRDRSAHEPTCGIFIYRTATAYGIFNWVEEHQTGHWMAMTPEEWRDTFDEIPPRMPAGSRAIRTQPLLFKHGPNAGKVMTPMALTEQLCNLAAVSTCQLRALTPLNM